MATATGSWTKKLKAEEIRDDIIDEKEEILEEFEALEHVISLQVEQAISEQVEQIKESIKESDEEVVDECLEMQEEAANDPDLTVVCEPPTTDWIRNDERTRPLQRSSSKKQRNHHYAFDVGDNGLDINGFIIHKKKKGHKRHKFKVFLDTNENGSFDRKDELIGKTSLTRKLTKKGIGNLLNDDELGQLEIKFKKDNSNALMRGVGQDDSERNPHISLQSFSFFDSDDNPIASVNSDNCIPCVIATNVSPG